MKIVHHAGLGDLTYQADPRFHSAEWIGTVVTPSGEASVTLMVESEQDELPPLQVATALETVRREAELRYKIAEALEELANDWQDVAEQGEPPRLTAAMMVQRMTISGFSVDADGELVMYYNDGDLFFGHTMMGIFDRNFNLTASDIPG